MNPEGELVVRLGLKANRVHSVNIASSRVALPERMTRGRSADEVARTLPLLFSICARAQAAAAAGALDARADVRPMPRSSSNVPPAFAAKPSSSC